MDQVNFQTLESWLEKVRKATSAGVMSDVFCLGYCAVFITLLYLLYCQALCDGPTSNQCNGPMIMDKKNPAFVVLVGDWNKEI